MKTNKNMLMRVIHEESIIIFFKYNKNPQNQSKNEYMKNNEIYYSK